MLGFLNAYSASGGGWLRITENLPLSNDVKGKILVAQSNSSTIIFSLGQLGSNQENVITNIGSKVIRITGPSNQDRLKLNGNATPTGWCEVATNGSVYTVWDGTYLQVYGVFSSYGSNTTAPTQYLFNNGAVSGYSWDSGHIKDNRIVVNSTSSAYIDAGTHTSDQYGYAGTADSTSTTVNLTGYNYLKFKATSASNGTIKVGSLTQSINTATTLTFDLSSLNNKSSVNIQLSVPAAPVYQWSVGSDQIWEHGQYQSISYTIKLSQVWATNE